MALLEQKSERPSWEFSIHNVESKLDRLQRGQEELTEEFERLNNEKRRLQQSIFDLEKSRASIENQVIGSDFDKGIIGLWSGKSGKILLYSKDGNVTGDYDWKGYKLVGHIKGKFDGKVLRFRWNWDLSSEQGHGFFIFDERAKTLNGGWFLIEENIDLEEAIRGSKDNLLHPWSFTRATLA
jgi:hypothetical protein